MTKDLKVIAVRDEKQEIANELADIQVEMSELEKRKETLRKDLTRLMIAEYKKSGANRCDTDKGVFNLYEMAPKFQYSAEGKEIKDTVINATEACLQFLEGESTITFEVANAEPLIFHIEEQMGSYSKEGTMYIKFTPGQAAPEVPAKSPFKKTKAR